MMRDDESTGVSSTATVSVVIIVGCHLICFAAEGFGAEPVVALEERELVVEVGLAFILRGWVVVMTAAVTSIAVIAVTVLCEIDEGRLEGRLEEVV